MPEQTDIFERRINLEEDRDFERLVSELASRQNLSVLFCNVHMLMLSQEDSKLAKSMDSASWIFADGVPVAWLQRHLSGKDAQVIRGYEIMLAVCERAARTGEKVGFIGSTLDVMKDLVRNLAKRFEGLPVAYQYCPPLMKEELISSQADLQVVKDSGIKWLFVGLGCPKQEKWIAKYGNELGCHVLGVGAAFDWYSEAIKKPPRWMERLALAWLYRFLQNPLKMWYRYMIYNIKFILKSSRYLLGIK